LNHGRRKALVTTIGDTASMCIGKVLEHHNNIAICDDTRDTNV
jgi:hypothetical protein